MLQGRYWIDQFRRVIGAQTDSAAPTGNMSLRLVGLGSIPRGFICLLTKIFGVLSGGKVSASSRGAFSFNSFPCSLCGLLPRLFARGLLFCINLDHPRGEILLPRPSNYVLFAFLFFRYLRPF